MIKLNVFCTISLLAQKKPAVERPAVVTTTTVIVRERMLPIAADGLWQRATRAARRAARPTNS